MKKLFRRLCLVGGLLAATGCSLTPAGRVMTTDAPLPRQSADKSAARTASLGFSEAPHVVRANLKDGQEKPQPPTRGVRSALHETKGKATYLPTPDDIIFVTTGAKKLPPAPAVSNPPIVLGPPPRLHPAPNHPCVQPAPCPMPCPVKCPKKPCCPQTCVYGYAEYLYLNARGVDVPFGQAFDGAATLRVPRSRVGLADPEYSSGFRVGAGTQMSECSYLQGTYTYYDSDTVDSLTAPTGTSINPLLIFPNTFNSATTPLDAINVQYSINFQFADLEFKNMILCNKNFKFNYLVGGRFASLDQDLRSTFTVLSTTTVDTDIDFWGGGIRGGLDGEYHMGAGFYSYGKGFLNLIAGHFDAKYTQRNNLTGLQAETQIDVDRVVPILEMEVGAGWQSKCGHVRIHGGYHFGTWFNVLTTPSLVQGVRNTNYTTNGDNFRDNITFDGLVGRVEFRY